MTAYAQNVTMTGTVVDTDNLPLIGVNVVIKGTSTGTTTDLDGKFTLTGENGQTLVFSYIGMTLQEIVYKGKPLHVIMKDDSKALEEVVIIGYQTVKWTSFGISTLMVLTSKRSEFFTRLLFSFTKSSSLSGNGVNSSLSFLKAANSAIENNPAPLSSFQNSSAISYNVFLKSGPK